MRVRGLCLRDDGLLSRPANSDWHIGISFSDRLHIWMIMFHLAMSGMNTVAMSTIPWNSLEMANDLFTVTQVGLHLI